MAEVMEQKELQTAETEIAAEKKSLKEKWKGVSRK